MSDVALAIFMTILFAIVIFQIRRTSKELILHMNELKAQVEAQTQVEASAVTLINGLHDQLVAAGNDPAKLDALRASLKTSADALAAAVAANTPAAQ